MITARLISVVAGFLVSLALAGCASWESDKGVETIWRHSDAPQWNVGKTTDADVINVLGPPSQIIALDNKTVFYYLHEKNKGQAYIFILWNRSTQAVEYDRAIFFFDKQGVLLKYSYSISKDSSEEKEVPISENQ